MDFKRSVLWIIFVVSLLMLVENWQRYHGRESIFFRPTLPQSQSQPQPITHGRDDQAALMTDLPNATDAINTTNATTVPNRQTATAGSIHIKTDVYDAQIDTLGGTLSKLTLIKKEKGKQSSSLPDITLFNHTPSHFYLARTGLIGGDFPNHHHIFTAAAGPHELTDGMNTLEVRLESPIQGSVKLIKSYIFKRGSYVIDVRHKIVNVGTMPIRPILYMELVRDNSPVAAPRFSHTFIGPAVYTSQQHLQKITFGDIDQGKANHLTQVDNGWIAMIQHYFACAWIPPQGALRDIYVGKLNESLYRIGVKQPIQTIAPGKNLTLSSRLFAGPQAQQILENTAPGLELVRDYGLVTVIAKPLFWLLSKIYSVLGNWGWSIVTLTLLIKAAFFPLSAASFRSMARMKEIMPRVQTLRERFKNDPQKMSAALAEFYKKEKVNPFGGCLPVLVQIPVFISLYWVLLSSVEMRGARWIGWIHDLSQQDPYFILPILMAISMLVQTWLNPTPPDPMQAKVMRIMPIAFSVIFFFFPAGLVLYYVVNNVLSILQQWYITRIVR